MMSDQTSEAGSDAGERSGEDGGVVHVAAVAVECAGLLLDDVRNHVADTMALISTMCAEDNWELAIEQTLELRNLFGFASYLKEQMEL